MCIFWQLFMVNEVEVLNNGAFSIRVYIWYTLEVMLQTVSLAASGCWTLEVSLHKTPSARFSALKSGAMTICTRCCLEFELDEGNDDDFQMWACVICIIFLFFSLWRRPLFQTWICIYFELMSLFELMCSLPLKAIYFLGIIMWRK